MRIGFLLLIVLAATVSCSILVKGELDDKPTAADLEDAASGGSGPGGAGGSAPDAATGGVAGGTTAPVLCGSVTCQAGEFCCVFFDTGPRCVRIGDPCANGSGIFCDEPEDCQRTEVCCGEVRNAGSANPFYDHVSCAHSCSPSPNFEIFCGADGVCEGSAECQNSTILPQYKVCLP